jgi:hypothetical protein
MKLRWPRTTVSEILVAMALFAISAAIFGWTRRHASHDNTAVIAFLVFPFAGAGVGQLLGHPFVGAFAGLVLPFVMIAFWVMVVSQFGLTL